ncbi:helix-turn-helix, type 11 domain protein [Alicycliphilus sp. B1]|nr:helix-turn-helix, type 11 domain protein [Alicycliphilus sp. B1]
MDALERENRLWQARAAVGQDLDRLTAEAVALALDADPGQRARVAAANAASRLLLRLVDRVADSDARIEDVAALFRPRPFTEDFMGRVSGVRIDAALQRLRELSVLTQADVERLRSELHGASP